MRKVILLTALASFILVGLFFLFKSSRNAQSLEQLASRINKDDFYIENLRKRNFVANNIEIIKLLQKTRDFNRYLIRYKSEELKISGMMNLPLTKGPLPAIILNHGFFSPKKYKTGRGTKEVADYLATRGYVTIASDYRNRGGSDRGPDIFNHFGSLYDVLYLLEAVKQLEVVDPEKIGMWGHSKGGWIALKVIAANKGIKVAALFSPMSADDLDNYKALRKWHPGVVRVLISLYGEPDKNP
ncbi:MAG: alpha/beta hydrolase family protein, partial [Candidatus Hodarchaeota archaeon]